MKILHVYHSNRQQQLAFKSFRASEGAVRFHSRCLIEEAEDSHYFANIRELADARRYAGLEFHDLKIADKEQISAQAINYLKSLIRLPHA